MTTFDVATFCPEHVPATETVAHVVVWIHTAGLPDDGVDVALALWTPAGARITALREAGADLLAGPEPRADEPLAGAEPRDDQTLVVAAGRWTDAVRELELCVALPASAPGEEMLAARVSVLAGSERVGGARVAVTRVEGEPAGEPSPPASSAGEPSLRTAAMTPAELPTGASPEPRHTPAGDGATTRCPDCGELPDDGDRYCEACGRELA